MWRLWRWLLSVSQPSRQQRRCAVHLRKLACLRCNACLRCLLTPGSLPIFIALMAVLEHPCISGRRSLLDKLDTIYASMFKKFGAPHALVWSERCCSPSAFSLMVAHYYVGRAACRLPVLLMHKSVCVHSVQATSGPLLIFTYSCIAANV